MTPKPLTTSMALAFASALALFALTLFALAGCAGTDTPEEWKAWIDTATYDQVVREWGEPTGCQQMSATDRMCEWDAHSYAVSDRRLLLMFDQGGVLRSVTDARTPRR